MAVPWHRQEPKHSASFILHAMPTTLLNWSKSNKFMPNLSRQLELMSQNCYTMSLCFALERRLYPQCPAVSLYTE